MGPSPTYHPSEGEESDTSVEHGCLLRAERAVGSCSRRPRFSPTWGSCFVGTPEVGPWVAPQRPLCKSPLGGRTSPEMTYLPTSTLSQTRTQHTPSHSIPGAATLPDGPKTHHQANTGTRSGLQRACHHGHLHSAAHPRGTFPG